MTNIFDDFHPSDINPDTSIRSGAIEHSQEIDEQEFIDSRTSAPLEESEARAIEKIFGSNAVPDLAFSLGGDRAVQPIPGGQWVPPKVRQARINAVKLPKWSADRAEQEIASIVRFATPPAVVEEAAQAARDAAQKARDVLEAARHPETPAFAINVEAKQAVETAVAEVQLALSRLEEVAAEHADEWLEGLTHGLEAKRRAAEKAVRAAYDAYADFANTRAAAHALAEQQGRFAGGWHSHPDARDLDPAAAIGALAKVRRIVSSTDDDWLSGAYLTAEYEGFPPHTLRYLEKRAEATDWGSFTRQIAYRAKTNRSDDPDLQRAIALRDLRILNNSAPLGFTPRERDED